MERVRRDRVMLTNQLDVGIEGPKGAHRAQDGINLAISSRGAFLFHQWGRDVERPTVFVNGFDPTGRLDLDASLAQPVEQFRAVVDLLVYQRDRIHRYTPSGS